MSDAEAKRLAKFVRSIMAFIRLIHMESGRLIRKYEKTN
jgi:hypothetical protein